MSYNNTEGKIISCGPSFHCCVRLHCSFFSDILEPSPPVRDYRFSVGQLPAWAKKQVSYFDKHKISLQISALFLQNYLGEFNMLIVLESHTFCNLICGYKVYLFCFSSWPREMRKRVHRQNRITLDQLVNLEGAGHRWATDPPLPYSLRCGIVLQRKFRFYQWHTRLPTCTNAKGLLGTDWNVCLLSVFGWNCH